MNLVLTSLAEEILQVLPANVERKLQNVNITGLLRFCHMGQETNVVHVELSASSAGTEATAAAEATPKAAAPGGKFAARGTTSEARLSFTVLH